MRATHEQAAGAAEQPSNAPDLFVPAQAVVSLSDEQRQFLVRSGLLCCAQAEVIRCVCMLAFRCAQHIPFERHYGTHD